MLLSYKNRFIFIHNYRVAGSSISYALRKYSLQIPYFNKIWIKTLESMPGGWQLNKLAVKFFRLSSFRDHHRAQEIKKVLPENIWDDFFKFGFVRNPWDWQVSLYHFMLRNKNHHQHQLIKNMKSFDQYIDWRVSFNKHLQKDFFYDSKNKLLVNFVGKFENLEQDFTKICEAIGIKTHLPHDNRTKHEDYHQYYNQKTKDLISQHFREDIKLFNYEF